MGDVSWVLDPRTLRFLIDVDVSLNETVTGNRRTISAELGSRLLDGSASPWDRLACAALDRFEPQHCIASYRARSLRSP